MLRLAAVASLLLALAVTAAGQAKAPKPNPCKGPKAKKTCPSSIPYWVTVRYSGTETITERANGRDVSKRVRKVTWSFRTSKPAPLYHVGNPSLGNIALFVTGKGTFTEKITSTSYAACDGTKTVTNDESYTGESAESVYMVSSTRGGPAVRPKSGFVGADYAIASGGYSCVVNGAEIRLEPKTDTGSAVRTLSRLVIDGAKRSLFSIGSEYGERSIHPDPVKQTYSNDTLASSWTWTFSFERAD